MDIEKQALKDPTPTPQVVMQITHHVLPEYIDLYIEATRVNAEATRKESGNIRFDVLRDPTDPCRFLLYEVYIDRSAHQIHLASAHFMVWKNAVQHIFSDRSIQKFETIYIS